MIAAIYARKSTEQHVTEDQKSVRRQIDHACEYATRKGWTVDERYIYRDDGVSGAEFARRQGFMRLMAALKPRPPFQVLVLMEVERLGRESIATLAAFKEIVRAGVRIFLYLDDRELALGTLSDNTMLFLRAEFAAEERRKASQRTADAMARKARAGHVTGGRVFGYDNVDVVGADGKRSHVGRRKNPAQAAVVEYIFTLKADGLGQWRIARRLNEEGVVSPRPQQGRRPGWATSSVRTVLFNPLYRGEIVYKRTRKRDQWGQKHVTDRPPTEWIHVPAPELRIVSDPLWQAAHARIDAARALYHDVTKGLRGGRRPVDSKYLLPGLARCAVCNGGLFVRSSNHGSGDRRWRVFTYACTTNRNRGAAICPNNVRMPMTQVDVAVLAALREDVFTPDLVDDVLARARGLDEADRPAGLRDRLADELAAVDRQLANLAEAIALGGQLSVLVARVQETDRRRQELARQIRQLDDAVVPRIDWRAAERHARGVLTEWRALLAEQPSDARPLLRELLAGEPIRFTPIDEPTRSGYRFEGTLVIGGLLEGFVGCNGKWRPHRVIAAFSCPRSGARCETWRRLRAAAAGALLRLRLPA